MRKRKFEFTKEKEEIEDGLFPEASISRELNILFNIAKYHNLIDYFIKKINNSKKNSRVPLEGNAISPRLLYLDALEYKIFNVYDASYAAHYAHLIIPKFTYKKIKEMLLNSINYRFLSFKKTNVKLKDFYNIE